MKLQRNLIRVNEIEDEDKAKDDILIVEQLLEVLSKELDQCSVLGISASRVLSKANVEHSCDGLMWTLRRLHHLFLLPLPLMSMEKGSLKPSSNKIYRGWQVVWRCLLHGFTKFSNISSVVSSIV